MLSALKAAKRALIVHHWDADGICSASILYEALKGRDVDLRTPTLGNYYLTPDELAEIAKGGYDTVVVVDMSLPRPNLLALKERAGAEILLVDHHAQERIREIRHVNPIAEGGVSSEFPSTSWILTSFLERPVDALTVLGAVGDQGRRLKTFKAYKPVEEFMEREQLSFDDLLRMVALIDSSYIVGDAEGVKSAVLKLLNYGDDPSAILVDEEWNEKVKGVRDEIDRQLSMPETRRGRVVFKEISSRYNVISSVARRVAWGEGDRIAVVVNKGFFENRDQIYVRCDGVEADLFAIVREAKSRGCSAGGRDKVIGIVSPKAETDRFVGWILDFLVRRSG